MNKRILFICGSINQTTQMHQIAGHLPEYDHYFTPYYDTGFLDLIRRLHLPEFSILGNKLMNRCISYLKVHDQNLDFQGRRGGYDLVVTCSDLVVPRNIRGSRIVLVQEGMTEAENLTFTTKARRHKGKQA